MINQAANLEQYRNTLNVVMKDQKKAAETFQWAVQFANKTPYETDEVVDATVKLQSYGMEAQKVLPYIGDMASAMGKGLDQGVEAVADAQTGELERLKEFGITKQMIVEQGNKKLKGIELVNNKGQITNQRAFNAALMSLIQDRYKGSMEIQSKSWKGIMSTISGVAKNGLATIAGISQTGEIIPGSAFDIAKQKATQLGDAFTKLQESGKFEELQKQLAYLVSSGLTKVEQSVPKIIDFVQNVIANGPQIISTVELIAKGFAAWKVISGVSAGVQSIAGLAQAISVLKNQYILLSLAKAKDRLETVYLQALIAKDAIIMGAKTAAMWVQTGATTALTTAQTFLTGTLIPGTVAVLSATVGFIANTAAKVANVTATILMTGATLAWNAVCVIATAVTTGLGIAIAFLTSPIGLVILAIGALIGVAYLLYQNWGTISAALVGVWQNNVVPFFQGIGAWFSGIFDGIGSGFRGVVNWVIGGLNSMINAVNSLSIDVPDWVPGLGGKTIGFKIANIPTFAKGGIANTASIFGEAGPEMAIPLKPKNSRSISLLNKTAQILGVGTTSKNEGNTFIFAPNIYGGSGTDVKNAIEDTFEEFKAMMDRYNYEKEVESF